MPIISADVIDNKNYRVTVTLGHGALENIVITNTGLYSIFYIRNGKSFNFTGKIPNIVINRAIPQNSFVLFDHSEDNSNKKERITFSQIQYIKDVTPNDAYRIALEHGFVGTVEDWLESMRGAPGKDNYEIAVDCGYTGTREQWIQETRGLQGYSAYDIAVRAGFEGTEEEWLESLHGESAYKIVVTNGYTGTEEEWLQSLHGAVGESAYQTAVNNGFVGTEEDWLKSLKGKSSYELAVANGFLGTEQEWLNDIGDNTELRQRISRIESVLEWIPNM